MPKFSINEISSHIKKELINFVDDSGDFYSDKEKIKEKVESMSVEEVLSLYFENVTDYGEVFQDMISEINDVS